MCVICNRRDATAGYRSCAICADRMWYILANLQESYALLCEPDSLVPGGLLLQPTPEAARGRESAETGDPRPFVRTSASAPSPTGQGAPIDHGGSADDEPDATRTRRRVTKPPRRQIPGSKSPARDDVIVMTDRRSAFTGQLGDRYSIQALLCGWCDLLAVETGAQSPHLVQPPLPPHAVVGWVPACTAYLRRWWDHIHKQEWVVELDAQLKEAQRQAAALLTPAIGKPQPIGRCNQPVRGSTNGTLCGGPLWQMEAAETQTGVKCGWCGWEMTVVEATEHLLTTGEAAQWFDTNSNNIRQWLHKGGIKRTDDGRIDIRELYEYLEAHPKLPVARSAAAG